MERHPSIIGNNMEKRFEVMFHPDAAREYENLDNSVIKIVNTAIDKLEYRADEVGKRLSNTTSSKLAGCKEIKLRDAGIRIVFNVTNEVVQVLKVVYILTIQKRSKGMVFEVAHDRFEEFNKLPADKAIDGAKKLKAIISNKRSDR